MLDNSKKSTDVLVIGGGHAACEAALAAARLGAETVLLTINPDHIAQMSCNPAIGGIAKGQLVREIDALGGEMGKNTDAAAIQFRMLNLSRGPAVHSPRAQCDKQLYQQRMKQVLENQPRLRVQLGQVEHICQEKNGEISVRTQLGEIWRSRTAVIATGTFLKGRLHYGSTTLAGGRAGDPASTALSDCLAENLGLEMGRLKTGTPPRLLAQSIDFSGLAPQDGHEQEYSFSFHLRPDDDSCSPQGRRLPQLPCYTTRSTSETARIVRENIQQSPLYSGRIEGIGARYCPSFEDKIIRFPQQPDHLVHLEPEGLHTGEYYLNGISTSLPPDVQCMMVRSLPGLENAHITRYGYAIEYDFVYPHQLERCLALRNHPNVFLAGQINGTSGYEEAAAQGLIAGVNAARKAAGDDRPFTVNRDQGYIGVMIDDLITKEIIEPYRLFTSRAEYRLRLRQDNADRRLTPLACETGLLPPETARRLRELETEIDCVRKELQSRRTQGATLWSMLGRPEKSWNDLPDPPKASPRAIEQLRIEARYDSYMRRESAQADKMKQLGAWNIPPDFGYDSISGLRDEARVKLNKVRPDNLAQAARIDGVTPAEIALLQVWLERNRRTRENPS